MLTPRRGPQFRPAARADTGKVRIIGGNLRNSKLPVLDRPGLRPTPDRVRETLFNWLAPSLDGARCLDLHAGTGALGIEALSRGAACVELVEADRDVAANLCVQLVRLRIAERGRVRAMPVETFLREAPPHSWDVVFVDPPYAADAWSPTLEALTNAPWLSTRALIYLEWPEPVRPALPPSLDWWRQSRAGTLGFGLARASA